MGPTPSGETTIDGEEQQLDTKEMDHVGGGTGWEVAIFKGKYRKTIKKSQNTQEKLGDIAQSRREEEERGGKAHPSSLETPHKVERNLTKEGGFPKIVLSLG